MDDEAIVHEITWWVTESYFQQNAWTHITCPGCMQPVKVMVAVYSETTCDNCGDKIQFECKIKEY